MFTSPSPPLLQPPSPPLLQPPSQLPSPPLLQPQPQLGEVELPSDVASFPIDLIAWSALTFGVFLLLFVYAQWLLRGKPVTPIAVPVSSASATSLQQDLQVLRESISHLSFDQLQEALHLSSFMRRASDNQWSATDEELLSNSPIPLRDALLPILHFTSRILFARCPASEVQWREVIAQTESWMKAQAEVQS